MRMANFDLFHRKLEVWFAGWEIKVLGGLCRLCLGPVVERTLAIKSFAMHMRLLLRENYGSQNSRYF